VDLCSLIERNAAFSPQKPALRFEGETLTYAVLDARIAQTARALKSGLGVNKGDRVAILSLNHPDYLVLLYACARLGAILVPLNWRLAVAEQLFILSDAAAKVLVLEQAFAEVLPALAEALPETTIVGLDFAPPHGTTFDSLLNLGTGNARNPNTDPSWRHRHHSSSIRAGCRTRNDRTRSSDAHGSRAHDNSGRDRSSGLGED